MRPSSVSPAVLALACHIVALVEDQVWVRVAVAVTSLTGIAYCQWVAIVTWCTPGWERRQINYSLYNTLRIYSINLKSGCFICVQRMVSSVCVEDSD